MAPDDTDPDVRDLRERVSELETDKQKLRARLDDQQETIQKLMPSRRQTLAGLGLLSAGGVAGRLSSGTAKAQAAGQVGTAADPVDVQAWDLNVQNSVASDLPMGGNDVTGVGALETEQITTPPTGAMVTLDSDQTIPHDTPTTVDWAEEQNYGTVSDILEASSGELIIPSGFEFAKLSFGLNMNTQVEMSQTLTRLNGISSYPGVHFNDQTFTARFVNGQSGWISVETNDAMTLEIAQTSGSDQNLQSDDRTYMGVWLL